MAHDFHTFIRLLIRHKQTCDRHCNRCWMEDKKEVSTVKLYKLEKKHQWNEQVINWWNLRNYFLLYAMYCVAHIWHMVNIKTCCITWTELDWINFRTQKIIVLILLFCEILFICKSKVMQIYILFYEWNSRLTLLHVYKKCRKLLNYTVYTRKVNVVQLLLINKWMPTHAQWARKLCVIITYN